MTEQLQSGVSAVAGTVLLSVVAPCYNEELVLHEFLRRMTTACERVVGHDYEIIVVNDGSRDLTWQLITEQVERLPNVVGVDLARNHGHQLAVTAGLSLARGERVLIIDADLQDPPELLGNLMALMDGGADVVYAKRRRREGETQFKLWTAKLFYRFMRSITQVDIPADAGDFRLINRRTLERLNAMPERYRFLRGMVAWLGGRQVPLEYDRDPRFAGETKYTLRKMIRFALDAITSFSAAPLRVATMMGLFTGLVSAALIAYTLLAYMFYNTVPGWTSMIIVISFFAMVQLLSIGIIGEYIGRMYMEVKSRPLFLISDVITNSAASVEHPDADATLSTLRLPGQQAVVARTTETQSSTQRATQPEIRSNEPQGHARRS